MSRGARFLACAWLVCAATPCGPRAAHAVCPTLFGTPIDSAFPLLNGPMRLVIDQEQAYWTLMAIVPNSDTDWDMAAYSSGSGPEPYCLSGLLASSANSANFCDFVVGDFNHNVFGNYYWESHCFSGNCGAGGHGIAVFRDGGDILTVNSPAIVKEIAGNDFTNQVGSIYDVFLNSGQKYWIRFSQTGELAQHLFLFRNPSGGSYWAPRGLADVVTDGCATYTAPSTGWYGLVIASDHRTNNPASYTVGVFSTPNCGCPADLMIGVPQHTSDAPAYYRAYDYPWNWQTFAVRGATGDWDLDVGPQIGAGPNQYCMASVAAHSAFSTMTDIVVATDTTLSASTDTLTMKATLFSGTGNATVQRQEYNGQLQYNNPLLIKSLGPDDLTDMLMFPVYPNFSYQFEISTFTPDLHIHRFGPAPTSPYYATRFQGPEYVNGSQFISNAYGYAAIVAVKDHLNSDAYSIRVGGCFEAFDWPDSTVFGLPSGLSWFRLPPTGPRWTAYTAFSTSADWDLEQYGHSTGSPWTTCLSSPGASSQASFDPDLLVGDRRFTPNDSVFVRAKQFSSGQQMMPTCQWREVGLQLVVNAPAVNGTLGNNVNVMDLYEVALQAGVTYTFNFAPSGAANQHLLLFGNPGATNYWAPRSAREFDVTGNTTFTPSKTDVYAVVVIDQNLQSGTYALRVTGTTVDVADGGALPATTRITSVSPNPGHGPVTIAFTAASTAPLAFDVLDAAGRHIATVPASATAGRGTAQWSGRDAAGRPIADGLYFLRLTEAGRTLETRKLVRVR